MWTATQYHVPSGTGFRLKEDGAELRFNAFFARLATDPEFVAWYSELLAGSSFPAFFWEHPPLTSASLDTPLEFVLIDAGALASLPADPAPFRDYFDREPDADVVTFPNLGGDARLIVPAPRVDAANYGHLASFLRGAPSSQVHALWAALASAVLANTGDSPIWLSTAGFGVAWLHVRLDTRPKYYRHRPYKTP